MEYDGVAVVISDRPCVLDPVKIKGPALSVAIDACTAWSGPRATMIGVSHMYAWTKSPGFGICDSCARKSQARPKMPRFSSS